MAGRRVDGSRRRWVARSAVDVVGRRETYRSLAYLLLAFPLGLGYFVALTVGFSLGLGLAIVGVGMLILAMTLIGALVLAGIEARLTNAMLGTEIRMRRELAGDSWWDRSQSLLLDRRTWTAIAYLPVKFGFGVAAFVAFTTGLTTAVAMMLVPLYHHKPVYVGVVSDRAPEIHQTIYLGWNYLLVGIEAGFTLGYWEIDGLPAAVVVAVAGAVCVLVLLHLTNVVARLWGQYARWSIDGGFDVIGAVLGGEDRSTDGTEGKR